MISQRFEVTGKRLDNGETVTGYLSYLLDFIPAIDVYNQFGLVEDSYNVNPDSIEPVATKVIGCVRRNFKCPNCEHPVVPSHKAKYCCECGQRLSWQEEPS